MKALPKGAISIPSDIVTAPQPLIYEEIHDVVASNDEAASTGNVNKSPSTVTRHPYEDVEAAGLQEAAGTGPDSYVLSLCSAYGMSVECAENHETFL